MPELDYGNIYNNNGKIIQHRYAQKAVDNGSTIIAMRNCKGAVIIASKPITSKLHVMENDFRIKKISPNVCMTYTGILTDGFFLSEIAKNAVRNYVQNFNTEVTAEYFKKILRDYQYIFTSYLGVRPLGITSFSIVKDDSGYSLLCGDLTGKITRWNACAAGNGERRAITELEKLDLENMTMGQMVDSGIKILYKCFDPLSDLKFDVEAAYIGSESEDRFVRIDRNMILDSVERYKDISIDGEE